MQLVPTVLQRQMPGCHARFDQRSINEKNGHFNEENEGPHLVVPKPFEAEANTENDVHSDLGAIVECSPYGVSFPYFCRVKKRLLVLGAV